MAEPVLVVKVSANMTELRKAMQDGSAEILTTKSHMQSMANSFDGARIISQAGAVQAQIQALGGATNLTAGEQARANRILEEALAKYQALGKEAPPGMQKLADETRQVSTASTGLTDTVKSMALAFAGMFTARAAFNFVKDTVAEASALKDLAQQTHINVEELQSLAGAMSEFGVDADTLGKGLFTLSRKIAKGDDSVSDALKQMGMELQDVRGLQGEELFLSIMRGLSKLQGGLRDETASEMFGSKLGMAMAGASEDIEGTLATWKRFNTVMSRDTVDALDRSDEAIKRMNKSLGMVAANLMGPVAEGFNVLFDATSRGASKWEIFVAMTKDWASSNTATGASTEHLARLLDGLNQKTEGNAASTTKAAAAHREYRPAVESTAGATAKARKETEELEKANQRLEASYAKLMSEVKNANQLAIMEADAAAMAEKKKRAAEGWVDAMTKATKASHDAAAAEDARIKANQASIDAEMAGLLQITSAQQTAATVSKTTADTVVHGFAGITQQVELSADAIRGWLDLMRYTAQANAILQGGSSLFTTQSQRERVAALPIGARAAGGPVSAGSPYMVGERGPELFVPERSGSILPHGAGGTTVIAPVINVNGPVDSSTDVQGMVSSAILDIFRSGGLPLPASL